MTSRALLSVSDKTNLLPLARALHHLGWQLIASGGTARTLRAAQLPVTGVSDVTGAPEMLAGRVKTLHPAIHAPILARDTETDRTELARHNMQPIDLVVCNLYPFRETIRQPAVTPQQAIEQIDIGGVTLLRAAAKNHQRVTVLCDPADYDPLIAELQTGPISAATRLRLAAKAFRHTRDYDTAISGYFLNLQNDAPGDPPGNNDYLPPTINLTLSQVQSLRYGENPHQAAGLYAPQPDAGPLGGQLLQGKPLSYNNLLDLDAAWRAAASFREPTVVIVKHLSPCGIATHPRTIAAAFPHALASDPTSAFGGVIAANRPVDAPFTAALDDAGLFVEAIIAPHFTSEAQQWFAAHKKNCRLLALPGIDLDHERTIPHLELRAVRAGYLLQQQDSGDPPDTQWRTVTQRQPDPAQRAALHFAWQAVTHVKSNAIVLARHIATESGAAIADGTPTAGGTATIGIGGGLPSRVDAVRLAIAKAGPQAHGAVLASDAFFPFPDGVQIAAEAGISAIVQPGGSIRDDAVIAAADTAGLVMLFTGARHFRH